MHPATDAPRLPAYGSERPGPRASGAWHPSVGAAALLAALLGAAPLATVLLLREQLYRVLPTPTFLVFHNFAETFSIVVSLSIFGVGWFTHRHAQDRHTLFLACVFLGVGLMDFMHAMSLVGMPAFFGANGPSKSTQYWIAARLFTASALLASAFVRADGPPRWISKRLLLPAVLAVCGLVFVGVTFFPHRIPATFDPAAGLTGFKLGAEYAIIALFLAAIPAYAWRARRADGALGSTYVAAFVLSAYGELVFTAYRDLFDTFDGLGHLYKVAAFCLVYRAIFVARVEAPYVAFGAKRRALEAEIEERKAVEEALRRNEDSLKVAQRIAHMGNWDLDLTRNRLLWSDEIYRIFEIDPRAFGASYDAFLEAVHPEDRQRVNEAYTRSVATRTPYEIVHRLLMQDGRVKHVRERCETFYDEAGTPLRSIGTVHDVTERLEAEARERSAARYARSLIEASLDPLVTISPEGKVTDVNRATEEATGIPRDRLVGTDFADAFTEPERARAGYRQVLERGTVRDYPLTIRRASGTTVDVLFNATVYRDEAGRLQGVFAAARDVTERKRAEAVRAHLAAIIEFSDDAIIGKGLDGVVQSWNVGAERMYGYPAAEMIGRPIGVLAPPELATENVALLDRIRQGEDVVRRETVRVRKDGERIDVSLTISPIRDAAGAVVGASTIARDITERRRAQQQLAGLAAELERRVDERTRQLAAANRELEAFAYSVSHDLRAPLRHIAGFVELLLRRVQGRLDVEARRYATVISEAAGAMGTMIDDLLSFSRMGRAEMAKSVVEVGPLFAEIIRELGPETEGRIVEWKVGALPPVTADRQMLRLALTNLLANAAKFTRTRSRAEIEIGCAPSGERPETVIFVRDNGVGFDMKYADKLFNVFQRLHRAEDFEGTGIGLANVRRIVERHGGRVWAESAPDRGATFFLALPSPPPGGTP